ncbi:DUF6292 family protein [Actinomadura sp. 6K520]|uniref:DUF6292 family protein n=1 Tax=Actinomadura sp. 6K520 TaxID=2530364 RepID=UPI00104FD25F|nr:DUF6292 family protein [Actinomadura sp. 6K520]TDE32062.1 hypothetical protein E1289_16775 [Actinomadura sp. 6K520]
MSVSMIPAHHPDPEVDTAHGYVANMTQTLAARGIPVSDVWLDPKGPVDATIITGKNALVWDEWTGWRIGIYLSGRQGVRTVLKDPRQLGGGVLASSLAIADLVTSGSSLPLVTRQPHARDGLFDTLRRF